MVVTAVTADFGSEAKHFGDFTYALFTGGKTFNQAIALCAGMNGYLALPMVTIYSWL